MQNTCTKLKTKFSETNKKNHLKFDRKESKGEVLPRRAVGVLASDDTTVSWEATHHLQQNVDNT